MSKFLFRRVPSLLNALWAFLVGGVLLFALSCGSRSETVTIPSQTRCGVQAQAERVAFSPDGGLGTVRITANRECTWTAGSGAAWVTLSPPVTGQGDGSIQFTVASNADPASRGGTISVEDQRLQISQEGRTCEYRLSSSTETVEIAGGERTIQVTSGSPQCRWTAAADVPWITILSGREGTGSGAVTIRVDPVTGIQRTGAVTVAGQRVQIDQGSGCTYAIGTATFSVGAAGGPVDVPVSAPAGCAWTAESQAAWIAISRSSSGTGTSVVSFRVAATEGPARTGTLTVAGRTVTVTQSPDCGYGVEPLSYAAPVAGGAAAVAVRTGAGCPWSATSSSEWISITGGNSGMGPGEVRVSFAPNPGEARTGSLRIADQTVSVAQGSGCTFTVSPTRISVGAQAAAGAIQVTGPQGCGWGATSTAPWITIASGSSGSASGQVQYAVAANTGPAREGSLSIAGRTVPLTQASGCTYSVAPPSQDVPGSGGGGAASVTTAAGCPWTASSSVPWISLGAPSGTGPGQVPFTVAANDAPARTGTLTVAGQALTVNQASTCTWVFAPPSHLLGADGGNGNVLVIVSGACTWTAASNDAWITLTAGASGTGNGLVQFTAAPNAGPARTGSLTIAGQRYDVTEAAR